MKSHVELERHSELADAKLGVAEELGWIIAILAGVSAYLKLQNWLAGVAIAAVAYFVATYRYRQQAATAEDAYFRAAGLGKYSRSLESPDA